jgi:hypothetical protein
VLDYTITSTPIEQKFVEIEQMLKSNICNIEFTKKSGEHSTMVATLIPDKITTQTTFTFEEATTPKIVDWETITMWSTDRNGWRSLKTNLITKVSINND